MANTLEIIIKANDQASKTLLGVIDKAGKGFDSLGKGMLKSGAIMTAATAPFAAALISTVQSASQFEASMTNVGAVLGKSKSEMAGLSAEVLALGSTARAGPQAVALAFYDIVGGVADASTHMAILEAAIATAEAGNADLGATTSALIAIMNSYSMSAEEAAFASDVLTTVVGKGVGSMDEFASALPAVTGLAHSLGIGFDELGAGMAFITTKGFSAAEASTQLKAMMTSMINPNAQMTTALGELGYASGQAAIEELGLAGAFQALSAESPSFQSNMAGALGSVEALNGVIALSDENFADFEQSFKESAEGATDAARKIQLESLAAQTDLLKSSMEGLKITIGMALIPVITRLVTVVRPIVQSLIKWAQENPKLVSTIAAVVAGVGGLGLALSAIGAILTAVGAGFGLLLSPIGAVIALIALFGAAYKTNFLGFGDFIRGLAEDLKAFGAELKAAFDAEGLAGVGQLLKDTLVSGLGDLASWVVDKIVSPIATALVNADWSAIGASALDLMQQLANGLGDIGYWLRINIVYPLVEKLLFADWSGMAASAAKLLAGIAGGLVDLASWVGTHIVTPIVNAVLGADWGGLIETGWTIIEKIAEAWLEIDSWIMENLATPLGDAIIAQAGVIYEKAKELGGNILNGIVDALAGLPGMIMNAILGAIPSSINLGPLGSISLGGSGAPLGGGSSGEATQHRGGGGTGMPSEFMRALGGPVSARVPYLVGERGPELFVPSGSGRIVPNHDLSSTSRGGGSTGGVTIGSITINGVQNPAQFFDALEKELRRRNRRGLEIRGANR